MSRGLRAGLVAVGAVVCVLLLIGSGQAALKGQQFLVHAAVKGHVPFMRVLIALGADPGSKVTGGSPLYAAVWGGHLEAVELLVSHGVDVDAVERSGSTPLMAAASKGDDEVLRFLLAHGASPTAVSGCGNALDIALANRHQSTAALLVAAGAVPSRTGR